VEVASGRQWRKGNNQGLLCRRPPSGPIPTHKLVFFWLLVTAATSEVRRVSGRYMAGEFIGRTKSTRGDGDLVRHDHFRAVPGACFGPWFRWARRHDALSGPARPVVLRHATPPRQGKARASSLHRLLLAFPAWRVDIVLCYFVLCSSGTGTNWSLIASCRTKWLTFLGQCNSVRL
jgi:hypothetical protein